MLRGQVWMVSPEVGRMGARCPSQPTMTNTRQALPHRVVERLGELVIHVKCRSNAWHTAGPPYQPRLLLLSNHHAQLRACTLSFNPDNSPMEWVLLSPFSKQGSQGSEQLCNLRSHRQQETETTFEPGKPHPRACALRGMPVL